ncbi:MAG: WD40 repeat domain-containing protein, partial [Armatimonadetes bacterium]|nr:WD40 repeat domain-containing protein [Armatimonadota bacterium]
MPTYDLIPLGDLAGRPFHSIDVEHQLHLLRASDGDVADVLRAGFQLNLAATAASTGVVAHGISHLSGQLAAIGEGLAGLAGDVREGFADLAEGQQQICAAIDSGFHALAAELLAHRELLGQIRGVLDELVRIAANPRTTQAAEFSRQARANLEDALKLSGDRRTRLLDEALDLLTQAIQLNAQDFEAQFNLGWVYLVHRHDPARAAEHFDTAVLRSLTRAPLYAAYASRHLALARREAGELALALTAAAEAAEHAPADVATLLDHARYAALAGAPEAPDLLRRAIAASPQCWYEAAADPDFAGLGATLDAVLDEARQAARDLPAELDGLLFTVADEETVVRAALCEVEAALALDGYGDCVRTVASAREAISAARERLVPPIELATLSGHTSFVRALAVSSDGRVLASGSDDRTVRLWSLPEGRELATLQGHSGWVYALALSPDGRVLASGSGDNTVRLWSLPDGRELATLTGHCGWVQALSVSPDGRVLATGSDDHTVRLWSLPEGRELATLTGHTGTVFALAVSPDGRVLASGGWGNTVRLWGLATALMPRAEWAVIEGARRANDAQARAKAEAEAAQVRAQAVAEA